jgi:hypothetical protein
MRKSIIELFSNNRIKYSTIKVNKKEPKINEIM